MVKTGSIAEAPPHVQQLAGNEARLVSAKENHGVATSAGGRGASWASSRSRAFLDHLEHWGGSPLRTLRRRRPD